MNWFGHQPEVESTMMRLIEQNEGAVSIFPFHVSRPAADDSLVWKEVSRFPSIKDGYIGSSYKASYIR
jgi:hypothetical protein